MATPAHSAGMVAVEIEFPIVRTVMGRAGTGGRGSGAEGDPGAPLGGSRRAAEGFGGLRRTRGAPEVAGDAGGKLVARCSAKGSHEQRLLVERGRRVIGMLRPGLVKRFSLHQQPYHSYGDNSLES
jgi:hypothetical protein